MERSRFMSLLEIASNALIILRMKKLKNLHARALMRLVKLVLSETSIVSMFITLIASDLNGMK